MTDSIKVWPPAPEGQVIPAPKPPVNKTTGFMAAFSFYTSTVGLLFVIITRIIEYTGFFPNHEGRWYYQITSLDARIRDEFYYFGSFLVSGYCFLGLGILLGVLTRNSRRGKFGVALGVSLIVLDIVVRIGVPLLVPAYEPVRPAIILPSGNTTSSLTMRCT